MKLIAYASMITATLLFSGCDGNAGADQVVLPGSSVTMNASDSESIESLEWEQVSGPSVKLSDYTIYNPTFEAPMEGIKHIVFKVAITYKDDENSSFLDSILNDYDFFPDTVEVVVKENDKVLKTAQVNSSIEGDDGFYKKGIARNYVRDDAKGIVKDKVHNLIWQDDALIERTYSASQPEDTGLIDQYLDEQTAYEYCLNLDLAGIDTWRLPREKELRFLVDYSQKDVAIDPAFSYTATNDYIALQSEETNIFSGIFGTKKRFPRSIDFTNGIESHIDTLTKLNVRCVSGEKMYKSNFVRDDNQSLVHDTSNKLTWFDNERLSDTLIDAIEHCETLEYAGFDDWRMANMSELTTTLDYALSVYDLTNTSFYIGNFDYMMSSTAYVNDDSKVWAVDFENDESTIEVVDASMKHNYRCIRDSE